MELEVGVAAGDPGPYLGLKRRGEIEFQNENAAAVGNNPAGVVFFVLKKGDANVTIGV